MSDNVQPKICTILGVDTIDKAHRLITNQLFQERAPLAGHLETVIAVCEKYNLNPMLREIYVRVGEGQDIYPTLTVDGWYNLVNSHNEYNGCEFFEMDEMVEVPQHPTEPNRHRPMAYKAIGCKMYRKGREHAPIIYEYLYEVFNPNNTVYYTHPNRLLRHRSFIQAARVVFNLSGIYDSEEVEQILNGNNKKQHQNTIATDSNSKTSEQTPDSELDYEVVNPGTDNQAEKPVSENKETHKKVEQQETAEEPTKKEKAQPSAELKEDVELDDATRHQFILRLKSAASNRQLEECVKYLSGKAPEHTKNIESLAKQFAA